MSQPKPTTRPPAVAGTFYASDPDQLAETVDELLAIEDPRRPISNLRALIAPHAGYIYSGPIAASAYRHLLDLDREVTRVVLLGPAHRVPVKGLAVPSVDGFTTPLGTVPIDGEARALALEHPAVVVDDAAHRDEHSLEVHLPFLQRVLPAGWTLVPFVVGHPPASAVAEVLEPHWSEPETLVVVSTDLSHYLDHATAARVDRRTADAVVGKDVDALEPQSACGAYPLRGLLEAARHRAFDVSLLDLRTSADTAGDADRVVGYGAFAVTS